MIFYSYSQAATHYEEVQKETLQNEIRIRQRREKMDYSRERYRDDRDWDRDRQDYRDYRDDR